ncbi:TPA: hypothetical protein KKX32_001941 [Legionella pneumophila]|nr:hypothetical protein [Legionella pneumophila serogroup 1]HAT3863113.1 hypothetical protein [Legionella pneumophila]HCC3251823.1 hypothetical protein [Legionella pneumophila subsp. pneumophila]MCH9062585.1 hypothetical protein [Legionella pneumophila serogroup 1]MCH9065303.1 hypothetical protein [Legionella pneumophila serogroup 1]
MSRKNIVLNLPGYHDLAACYLGVQQLQNEVLRDYLLLIILTGLRCQEATTLC